MTEEDKDLLLKDLYARLRYGIKFKADDEDCIREIHYIKDENIYIREYQNLPYWIDNIKPYLRPISSMTEEESKEYFDFRNQELQRVAFAEIGRESAIAEISDWLNAHHLDYRGFIEKGLVLEAPKDMYKN